MLNLFLATNGPWFDQPLAIDRNNNNVDILNSTVLRWSLPQSISGDAISIMNCSVISNRKHQPVRICCNLLLDTDFNPEGKALALTMFESILRLSW